MLLWTVPTGVLVNITTAPDCLKMSEYREIMKVVNENAHPEAEVQNMVPLKMTV